MALLSRSEAEQVVSKPTSAQWVRDASWSYWTQAEHIQWQKFINAHR
jgi:hypothetical protein